MSNLARAWCLVPAVLALAAALTAPVPADAEDGAPGGAFSALTYNVAGLPAFLSSGRPDRNTRAIGERLAPYDLVHVQEDFNYHAALYRADRHPYRTRTSGGVPFGSGLNTLSHLPFSAFRRTRWRRCSGTDCLTPKGFTFMRLALDAAHSIDVYNAHANAGTTQADLGARRANVAQLGAAIAERSAGRAVLVMADTNTRYTRRGDTIRALLSDHGLRDAWLEREHGGTPPPLGASPLLCDALAPTSSCEVVDKILFRSGGGVDLALEAYANDHPAFLDAQGRALSDHFPIGARFGWTPSG